METADRTGLIASGAGHAGLILWALVGGLFSHEDTSVPIATTEVSLISSSEFDAMVAAAPRAVTEAPDQPSLPETQAEIAAPEPVDEPPPEQPEAEAEAQSEPDPAPDVTEITPPETEVTDTPPEPLTAPLEEADTPTLLVTPARPRPAPRVAPTPTEAPEPDVAVAETATAEVAEEPSEQPVETPPEEAAAPEEAGDVIETEENQDVEVVASAAPTASTRPRARPAEPTPATEPEEAAASEPAEAAAEPAEPQSEEAVAAALAEAMAGGELAEEPQAGTGTAASGPPLTSGEKDALVVAVKQCWNVGALSTDALRTVVTVGVSMGQDGKPDGGSIRMIGYEGGDDASARQAFEAGRRAILRCGARGFPLPPEKYEQWREVEIVFNPENMRMR